MIQFVDSRTNPIVFGSLLGEIEIFRFGKGGDDLSHSLMEEKVLPKGEDFKFLVGNVEDDYLSAKNDYLLISDYLSAKNDYLLAATDLHSKSPQSKSGVTEN
jgi:hypothetical protein